MPEAVPPVFLATAVESVIRAGEIQMAHFGGAMRVDKKGTIDLVTEIDLRVEREFRALIADRFPDHVVLGEEFSAVAERDAVPAYCWVFDPVDGTTNYAHGLPIFCSSLALEIRGEPAVAAIYDPNRRELFTAERGQGAWLNGAPLRVSTASTLIDSSARAGLANFGAFASLGATRVRCAALALSGDGYSEHDFSFEDRGGNACGCPEADGECKMVSAGLAPPDPPGSTP